jgi:hypothetical protein
MISLFADDAAPDVPAAMERSALFSPCGLYRYRLGRIWDVEKRLLVFCMLNPSTATAEEDDPTIRRCMGFARAHDYGGIYVINLFAYRSTLPSALRDVADPVGPETDELIHLTAFERTVVAAWGTLGGLNGRDKHVLQLLRKVAHRVVCLGITMNGHPRHPLYLRSDAAMLPFGG